MAVDLQSLIKGRKYPTIITNLYGEILRKTNHKLLKHPYLRKGAPLGEIVFENHFYNFINLKPGEKTTAIINLHEEYTLSVERQGYFIILSIVDKISYDLNRLPVFDDAGALLVRQSVLKFREFYLPIFTNEFCPAYGFSVICYIARRMFDGGELNFDTNYEDCHFAAYGNERRFYDVVSSMMAIAVECDIGDKVFAGGIPQKEGYRIVVTSKVYEGKETENLDTPEQAEEELMMIRRVAKENFWLFSAHVGENGIMELSLDLATHGFPKLALVTRDGYRNFPAIPAARFARVRHKGRPY